MTIFWVIFFYSRGISNTILYLLCSRVKTVDGYVSISGSVVPRDVQYGELRRRPEVLVLGHHETNTSTKIISMLSVIDAGVAISLMRLLT